MVAIAEDGVTWRDARHKRNSSNVASGARDKPVRVEYRDVEDAVDPSGYPSEEAQPWFTLQEVEWMNKRAVSGTERATTLGTSTPVDTRWTMNYRADMDPDLIDVAKLRRLVFENRRYDITFGETLEGKRGIVLDTVSPSGSDTDG